MLSFSKLTLLGLIAVAFAGLILALKLNYCHRLSTEPGFRKCSEGKNFDLKLKRVWVTLRCKISSGI